MRRTTLSRLMILVAVVALPVGAALDSYALADDVTPTVPAEVRIGDTGPVPAGGRAVQPPGSQNVGPATDPDLRIVVVSKLPPFGETDDSDDGHDSDDG